MYTHCDVLLILDKSWNTAVAIFFIRYGTAEVPQGPVQKPGWLQMRRVYQVITALRMKPDPLTVNS